MKFPKRSRRRRRSTHAPFRRRVEWLEERIVLDSTVVINEIMYHPAESVEADFEWVELFNEMAINMDLSGWQLTGAINYTFPAGTVIAGRSYVVIASNPTALAGNGYGQALGPYTGRLNNSGEKLELVNSSGRLLNEVDYTDNAPWPVGADGSGFSLAKIDPYSDSSDPKNWTTSRQWDGTPGTVNFPTGAGNPPGVVFNEFGAGGGSFFVEIANQGTSDYLLQGATIVTSAGVGSTYTFGSLTISPGQYVSLTPAQLGFGVSAGDKLFLLSAGKDRLLDAHVVSTRVQGLAAAHGTDWLFPSAPTPGAANSFEWQNDVVINEIMYHALPQYPTSPTYPTTTLLAIDASTTWRFNQSGANLGANWASTAHSGSGWGTGAGLFARNANSPPLTVRTTLSSPTRVTTYFETEFNYSGSLSDVVDLSLNYLVDDGAVFYLNGVEVLRVNMPTGSISSSTLASSALTTAAPYVQFVTVPKAALVAGSNRLSVEVHQASMSTSGDVVFGAEVRVLATPTPAGTVFAESNEEWIELYNRSAAAIDLGNWSLAGGISYSFPLGTSIAPHGYLVVAKDAAALRAMYPAVSTIIGNFTGSLSNSGEDILLLDARANPADDVHYFDGGDWPELADGGGSSLELQDPFAENAQGGAWAASNERTAGTWDTYSLTVAAATDTGPTGAWNEFLFGLLQAGEVLIDDVSVVRNPGTTSATQLLQNGSFQSDTLGSAPATWRIIGNEQGTVVADPDNPSNKVLDLVATGVTHDEGNNAGTTFVNNTGVSNGTTYQITFKARWVGGSPQLNARAYLDRFGTTFVLRTPVGAGTPGAANSTAVANAGPTYEDLRQSPVLPSAGQAVTVSIAASDPNGIASVLLWWRPDSGSWSSVPMTLGADGRYGGSIPGQPAGQVVQFYVQATDSMGAASTYPAAGANSRALYQVADGQGPSTPIDSVRVVMLATEWNHMFDDTNVMSNQDVGATVIYNNSEIFYNVGVRLKGSVYNRAVAPRWGSFQITFNPEHLFRGVQDEISLDASGSNLLPDSQYEILVKQLINHAGGSLPSNYDDLAYAIVPNSAMVGTVILQLARYDNEFLDASYTNGSDGSAYEFNFIAYSTKTTDGNVQSPKLTSSHDNVSASLGDWGPTKDSFRWNLQLKNNRAADDYTAMMAVARAFALTGTAFIDAITPLIDVDEWMRDMAMATLIGGGDNWLSGNVAGTNYNAVFYVRPSDGKMLLFPWDWDHAFQVPSNQSINANPDVGKFLVSPVLKRLFYEHMLDIINTTFNPTYMTSWVASLSGLVGQNWSSQLTYISARRTNVLTQLNSLAPQIPFAITTNGGNPFTVTTPTVTLTGNGWIDVNEIRLGSTGQALPVTWTSQTQWQVTVPLTVLGANSIVLNAFNLQGSLVGSSSIVVTAQTTIPQPVDWLRITELMYHPSPDGNEQFEFVELQNTGTQQLDLTGVQFTSGVQFSFPSGTTLAPGAFTVLVKDQAAFISRYGSAIPIGGVYTGSFANSGEEVKLTDGNNQTILDFTYADSWYKSQVDGHGYSLVIVNPHAAASSWGQQASWRPSVSVNGSPGAADSLHRFGDANDDGIINAADMTIVASEWLKTGINLSGDFNNDGIVNAADMTIIASNWLRSINVSPAAISVAASTTGTSTTDNASNDNVDMISSDGSAVDSDTGATMTAGGATTTGMQTTVPVVESEEGTSNGSSQVHSEIEELPHDAVFTTSGAEDDVSDGQTVQDGVVEESHTGTPTKAVAAPVSETVVSEAAALMTPITTSPPATGASDAAFVATAPAKAVVVDIPLFEQTPARSTPAEAMIAVASDVGRVPTPIEPLVSDKKRGGREDAVRPPHPDATNGVGTVAAAAKYPARSPSIGVPQAERTAHGAQSLAVVQDAVFRSYHTTFSPPAAIDRIATFVGSAATQDQKSVSGDIVFTALDSDLSESLENHALRALFRRSSAGRRS